MCLHATWLDSTVCTRCNLKPQTNLTSLGIERSTFVRRESTLPSRFTPLVSRPQPEVGSRCVGCGSLVNPGFCYKGSVLSDLIHTSLRSSQTSPILGTMSISLSIPPPTSREVVVGGHEMTQVKRIAFRKRTRGLICDTCASCTSTVEVKHKDGSWEKVPVVVTDVRGGYIGETSRHTEDIGSSPRKSRGFNTRFTQGRRGRRV